MPDGGIPSNLLNLFCKFLSKPLSAITLALECLAIVGIRHFIKLTERPHHAS